jgi:hypothetical protein
MASARLSAERTSVEWGVEQGSVACAPGRGHLTRTTFMMLMTLGCPNVAELLDSKRLPRGMTECHRRSTEYFSSIRFSI